MTFTESIKVCFQKYIDFSGRASRSEYWWFFLFTLIVRVATFWIPFLGAVIALALLLPSLTVTVRRLHDTNRTGWWVLLPIGLALGGAVAGVVLTFAGLTALGIALVALGSIVGFVVLVVFLVQPGDPHTNQYGLNLQPQLYGMGGYGGAQSGDPYAPPPFDGGFATTGETPHPELSAPDPGQDRRLFCSNCGMQLQPEAQFCTVCGTAL